jgi:tetratricopeptide (TPR) repeat protein
MREAPLRECARLIPGQAAPWISLGEYYLSTGSLVESLKCYRRAVELEPASPGACAGLLRLQLHAGLLAQAAAHLRAVLARIPFSVAPPSRMALDQLDRGNLRSAADLSLAVFSEVALNEAERMPGNPEMVMRRLLLYRLAADLAPDWTQAQSRCAAALMSLGHDADARVYLDRLRSLEPSNTSLQIQMAAGWLADGRAADARRELTDAVSRNAREPAAWFYLGQAEMGIGRKTKAVAAFKRFIALAPESPQAAEVRRVVQELTARR